MKITKYGHQKWELVTDKFTIYGTTKTDCLKQLEKRTQEELKANRFLKSNRFTRKLSTGTKTAFKNT